VPPGCCAVPPAGPGRCRTCRAPVSAGWTVCRSCVAQQQALGGARADAVLFAALAAKGAGLARALWRYKALPAERAGPDRELLAGVAGWAALHEPCLARAAGVSAFPVACVVPSGRGRAGHPLGDVLALGWPDLAGRLRPYPRVRRSTPAGVLLCDDTWTSGWHAQLAAAALKRAGVPRVGLLVLGRHVPDGPAGTGPGPAGGTWPPRVCSVAAGRGAPAGCLRQPATAGSARPG
jgi:hypothetical protein